MPKALVDEAAKRGMPLFEVPYEMPFIAITERAFARLVNEQYAVLERGARVHERLERLVIEGRGLEPSSARSRAPSAERRSSRMPAAVSSPGSPQRAARARRR